jgi:predicted nucleic acid-binding protein
VRVVLDASVIVKWLLQDPATEPHRAQAIALLESVIRGDLQILEPAHWLAEVGAVLARLSPETAREDVESLAALEFPTADSPQLMRRAVSLAIETGQHLFDTLYHAVALEHEALLITVDERYRQKAQDQGRILALHEWTPVARRLR